MAHLALALLGSFEANIDGQPAGGLNSDRLRALLAYLAVESERSHRREALAALLWDGYPQRDTQRSRSQALTNPCSLLSVQAPADPSSELLLSITGQSVQLQLDRKRVWADVHAFDSLLAAADPRHASALEKLDVAGLLAEAVALYPGPFLVGLAAPGSLEFEEWLVLQREQRHQATVLALEWLVSHHFAEGRTEPVEHYALRQLALELWSESGHQALVLALALEGQRGAALQQQEACRRVLVEQLDIEPSAATEALARQIHHGVLSQAMLGSGLPPAHFCA